MSDFIKKIFEPQLIFEGVENGQKISEAFADLYRIELFKDGLDLILTKLKQGHLSFEIKINKDWDTNSGCFLTEQKNYYDPIKGHFLRIRAPKIILRNYTHNLMAHEMAHALEFESGINFGQDFRKAIGYDMKDRQAPILTLRAEIKRLMVDALKAYPSYQFLSELFARYFELLSVSRNVQAFGDFATLDVMNFFENTTNFINHIFNPTIRSKIDPEISRETSKIVEQVKIQGPKHKFSQKVDPFKNKSEKSWSGNIRSNSMWHNSWKKIDDN
jgi:hypothetical protein